MRKFYTILLLVISVVAVAQQKAVPLLERTISISAVNEKVPSLLNRIGQAGGFSFSYNSAIIDPNQNVSLDLTNQTVRNVLNEIFKGSMNYKEKSNYLILTKAPVVPVKNNTVVVIINGYVEDKATGEKIPQASVYDKNSVTSAVTDEFGYFNLKLEKKTDSISLSVSKKNYRDTLVSITAPSNQYLTISIDPINEDSILITAQTNPTDSVEIKEDEEMSFPYASEPNVQNIRDTLYELVQVSFLPFLGTNGRLSGNIINDYSINFLGGYSLGTRQIELGFFFNLDRGDVSWLQIAGFGNVVGGKVYGIQAAGFANVNGEDTEAVQLAGFVNTNMGDTRGVQVAGFANTNLGKMNGVQVAGFSNVTGKPSNGVQVAGFGNVQIGDYSGSQFAGLTNIATEKITGSQISTLFNYGRKVHGTQIGLVNYADTLGGVPIGLLSIVKSGYHKIELSADEVFYTNLAFRSGVRKFHTMLMAGFKPQQSLDPADTSVWTFGYGLGITPKLNRWWYLDLDISSQHVNKGSFTDALSLLNKVYVGFDFQVAKKFSIATGVTFNGYLTSNSYTEYPTLFTDYHPKIVAERNFSNDTNLKMWWGAKVALRFL
ncbi:MAG TPA: STN and carboxypeptidase regulatory-like domain-containing protein [Cyclobacteriaceae bacterium]|nr:STN and carboxypeptidase regulatory-like domain-containing protein [Cyclobacteriaceae bacterium]HPW63603.1 STN and carboxypeptidase regulatory-like domain-containing protein [Cyclobacteriaceae bacterium]